MPLGLATFLDVYNNVYAQKLALAEIDSNASAAPMKMLLNAGNVIGLVIGGTAVGLLGYTGFFVVFSFVLFSLLVATVINKSNIHV